MNHEANRKDSLKWEPVYHLRSLFTGRVVEPERGGEKCLDCTTRGVSL